MRNHYHVCRTNVLLITADDLGYEAVDHLGGKVPDVMPNLSRLAAQSMSFQYAHVNVAICAPSRGVIATGRYGHNSGLFGFNKLSKQIPTVFGTFQKADYLTGILGKVSHSTPDLNFTWDFAHDYGELGAGRNPEKYYGYCAEFFAKCKREGKPIRGAPIPICFWLTKRYANPKHRCLLRRPNVAMFDQDVSRISLVEPGCRDNLQLQGQPTLVVEVGDICFSVQPCDRRIGPRVIRPVFNIAK